MKALSLHQPWASLMACGAKTVETRHWSTNIRGDVAICAAKKVAPMILDGNRYIRLALAADTINADEDLPLGVVLCVVDLFGIVTTDEYKDLGRVKFSMTELACGDYSPGRFAWLTNSLRRLKNPVPVIGRQGFWNLPPEVEEQVRKELP